MTKYLITGGCGFIGSHLADELLSRGHEVRLLDDLSTGKEEFIPAKAEFVCGSVTDPLLLEKSLADVAAVFHLAAIASVQKTIEQWHASHEVNQGATVAIFDAISHLDRPIPVLYASSAAVYGNSTQIPLCEEAHVHPLSPYGVDKLACELQARVGWELYRIPSAGLRFFNVYGPRQDPHSPYSGVISIFLERLKEGAPLTIFGDGEQKRDFIYVRDVARMLAEASQTLTEGAHLFNLCRGEETSINDLAELMGKILNVEVKCAHKEGKTGEVRRSVGDPGKIRAALHLAANYTLEEGLREFLCG